MSSMLLPKNLTALQYDGWEKLEANSTLPVNEQLRKLTSLRAFAHVEKLYDEAEIKRKHGDEEQAYILFSRMCEIAKMITKKSDFSRFKGTPDCRLLHDYFKKGLSKLDELQVSLTKRYKMKKEIGGVDSSFSAAKTDGEVNTEANISSDFGLIIHPRDLVHAVSNDKKVLIIDYRGDCSSLLKYECPGKVFIARIPPSAIIPGCISSTLIHSAEISERVTLQRMSDVDIVVLVGQETPLLENEALKRGTIEHMLFEGLYTYNNNFRLHRAPVFLDGGFSNWALHYPMHTRTKTGTMEDLFVVSGESKFLKNVAEYKQQIFDLRSVEYPDLLRRSKKSLKTSDIKEKNATQSSLPTVDRDRSKARTELPNVVNTAYDCHGKAITSGTTNIHYSKSDADIRVSNNSTDLPENEKVGLKFTVEHDGIKNDAAGQDDIALALPCDRTVKPLVPAIVPSRPFVDRATKPPIRPEQHDLSKDIKSMIDPNEALQRPISPKSSSAEALGGARVNVCAPSLPPVIPDRSKKPLLKTETKDPLFNLYKAALLEIDEEAAKSKVKPGYTGLRNLKNTCYMNATLQALFNTVPLRNIYDSVAFLKFINRNNSKGTLGVCSAAFAALMSAIWSGSYSVINPSVFRNVFVREVNRDFGDYEQHDAQEFQIFLLAALHEDMDQVYSPVTFQQDYTGKNLQEEALEFEKKWRMYTNSPVNDIFRSVTLSVKRCKACGRESVSFEEITQLSVAISQTSLIGCISAHFERIQLEGDSRWMCPKCKVYRDALLKTDIWRPPQILVVHLKRSTDGINKDDSLVEFNTRLLDLKHCIHPMANFGVSTYKLYAVISAPELFKDRNFFMPCIFVTMQFLRTCSLYSLLLEQYNPFVTKRKNHMGSLTSGHYTAFVQNVQMDGSKQWIVCDDDIVRPIAEGSLCTKNAVVLYFQKCHGN